MRDPDLDLAFDLCPLPLTLLEDNKQAAAGREVIPPLVFDGDAVRQNVEANVTACAEATEEPFWAPQQHAPHAAAKVEQVAVFAQGQALV